MSRWKGLPYLLSYLVPFMVLAGSLQGETWPFRAIFWLFFAVTLADTVAGERAGALVLNWNDQAVMRRGFWRFALWMWLPAQLVVILCGLVAVSRPAFDEIGMFSIAVSVGMTGGILGMPIAHELMHRSGRWEPLLATSVLTLMSYTHFRVEHVQGHHARVATADDPASARLGESLYAFYFRTVFGGFVSAWAIEARRLRSQQRRVLSVRNRVVCGLIVQGLAYSGIGCVFGTTGIAFFTVQSIVAISVLETINYVQHYGLTRTRGADGRYTAVTSRHAWNSAHPVSNWFTLNLGCHSDHHCHPQKGYWALTLPIAAPRLPTGLFGMSVLALFPPLWQRIMDPLVLAEAQRELIQAR